MSLFVEHVLFGINTLMPEFESLVKKYTLLLAKVSQDVIFLSLPCVLLLIMCILVYGSRAESFSFALVFCSVFNRIQT